MSFGSTDCLVLRIDEFDCESEDHYGTLDTSIYVLYDMNKSLYVINGKRNNLVEPYSFYCDNLHGVKDFISTIICKQNAWTYTLYNCDNLPCHPDDITFDLLEKSVGKYNELTGYDYQTYNNKTLKRMLRILRNVYNYY